MSQVQSWKLVFFALLLGMASACSGNASELILEHASVLDLERGEVLPDRSLRIVGGIIQEIADGDLAGSTQEDVRRIDLRGRFLLPGLWDMHIHPSERDLELLVANGVLGARIMWGRPEHLGWRAQIELGERLGPRLFIAGPIIEGTPPPEFADVIDTAGRRLLDTYDEGLAEARAQKAAGFDYLKVYNNLSQEAYRGLTDGSRRYQIPIIGHVPFEVGLKGVLKAGQLSIEHLRGYVQLVVPKEAPIQPGPDLRSRTLAWQFADPERIAELVEATRKAGAWECPTLNVRVLFGTQDEIEAFLKSPTGRFISPSFQESLRDRKRIKWLSNFSDQDFADAAKGFQQQDRLVVALHEAGVPILAGTDMSPLGFTLHDELESLLVAGMSPLQVLRAAITNPVKFVGLDGVTGKVAEGYSADLLVLDRNPLEDIRATRAIHAVVARGELLDRGRLDSLLKEASQSRD